MSDGAVCADTSMLLGVGETASSRSSSPAEEGEPPAKRQSTGPTFPAAVGVALPPPVPPPVTAQSEGLSEMAQALLPLVADMQMTLSIMHKLLSLAAHGEDKDPVLAHQVLHLAARSLQPLSHSMVSAAQQRIKSWPSSAWQQDADVKLMQIMPAANSTHPLVTPPTHPLATWPTHPLATPVVQLPVASGSRTSPVATANLTNSTASIEDEIDIISQSPGHSSRPGPLSVSVCNSPEASKYASPPQPRTSTPTPPHEPSPLPTPEDGPIPPPAMSSTGTADNSTSSPSGPPAEDSSASDSTADLDLLSEDEYTDFLMASMELPDELDDPLPTTRASASSSAAVQVWAPLSVRDFSSYDIMMSLPQVGVADRQEKLTAKGLPLYWSMCVRCSPHCTTNYHMVHLEDGLEMDHVARRLRDARMDVIRVSRVQNEVLWQRYRSEQVLMLQGAPRGYKLNEAWLYHTTSAAVEVICEEGLDPRLAHVGCFGSGTYFSDDPMKCFQYVTRSKEHNTLQMLLCRVLLGDIKVYHRGTHDHSLKREPVKGSAEPGGKKTYDSVQGNISGHNEYVVYNAYRVLPEYVIEYRK